MVRRTYTLTFDNQDITLAGGKNLNVPLKSQKLPTIFSKVKELHKEYTKEMIMILSNFEPDTKEFLLVLTKNYLVKHVNNWKSLIIATADYIEYIINVFMETYPKGKAYNYNYNVRLINSIIKEHTIVLIIKNMEDIVFCRQPFYLKKRVDYQKIQQSL